MSMEINELDLKAMGRRIRTVREVRGMTREKLAESIDVSAQFISDVEYGNKGVSIKTLFQLIQVLDVTAEYILSGQSYDVEHDEKTIKTCKEIKYILKELDEDALKGFREISRVYLDSTRHSEELSENKAL